jgi:hypothetical protein
MGDLVRQMVAHLSDRRVPIPFENEAPWHELFYQLKKEDLPGKPRFFSELIFDWDGPYPKCRQLSEFLHALHWNACVSAFNPTFATITLPTEIANHWKTETDGMDPEERSFVLNIVTMAQHEFESSNSARYSYTCSL